MINYDMIARLVAGMKKKYPRYKVETILREEGTNELSERHYFRKKD